MSCTEDVNPAVRDISEYEVQSQLSQIGDGSAIYGQWAVNEIQIDSYNQMDTLYLSMVVTISQNGVLIADGNNVEGAGVWQSDPNTNQLYISGLPEVFNTSHRLNRERNGGGTGWSIFVVNDRLTIFDNNSREKFILDKIIKI
ncbi:hypothetical protein [Persicobacter sp. CCB-QB2]|uniref:hypothetical protein n=1 Tax=Persicobacter sp. CCB-QB2 TaxID=1561025 RepID=UPI0006A9681A|nr:hypothetical protein [Persicobacter sp. CCB-QB2]